MSILAASQAMIPWGGLKTPSPLFANSYEVTIVRFMKPMKKPTILVESRFFVSQDPEFFQEKLLTLS